MKGETIMELFSGNKMKVICSRDDVAEFNAKWPGSKLRSNRAYWFEFDGDYNLVDTDAPNEDDGPELLALSQDAEQFLRDSI
jgi:hypothetical protein